MYTVFVEMIILLIRLKFYLRAEIFTKPTLTVGSRRIQVEVVVNVI